MTAILPDVAPEQLEVRHLSWADLEAGLETIRQSPKDQGVLSLIVVRPGVERRLVLQSCQLSPAGGVHGDDWAVRAHAKQPDSAPNVKAQVTLMNARAIALLAQSKARWPLAGDQLYVDFDLSEDNLQPGQRLAIGGAQLEITDKPHRGCAKFAGRFGPEALKFVNTSEGWRLHMRGIYARVIRAGAVAVGDTISKIGHQDGNAHPAA